MNNIIIVAFCLLAGIFIKKFKGLPHNSYKIINAWLINIAIPVIALKYLPTIQWDKQLITPILIPFGLWFLAIIFTILLSRFIKMDKATKATVLLMIGLANTSFLGFPITQAFYGDEALKIAILIDQATFIVMSTFGVISATKAASHIAFKANKIIRQIVLFPPFLAMIAAFILPLFIDLSPAKPIFNAIGATLVPLAIFSVGFQLTIKDWKVDIKLISWSLLYKLIITPLIVLLFCYITKVNGVTGKVTVLEAAMAPRVTAAIIAAEYHLNTKLANIILSFGILIGFLTAAIWWLLPSSLL